MPSTRKIEKALDDLLGLYGERRQLMERRRANLRAWHRMERRAHMKFFALAALSFIAFATASAGALLQAVTTRPLVLEWWPVIVAGAGIVLAVGVARQRGAQLALELAKKVDREIFDLKFQALDESLKLQFAAVHKAIDELRQDMTRNRSRATNRDAS